MCTQGIADQGFDEPLHSRRLSVGYDGQRLNQFSTGRRNSTWDPLIHHSPLVTVVESSDLAKGIKGTTIGKKISGNRPTTLSIENTQSKLPRICVNNHGRWHQDNTRIKFSRSTKRRHASVSKIEPLDCFKVVSLNHKSSNCI